MTNPSFGPWAVSSPSNIAFIKYWGARDLEHATPWNPSISMTLETCRSYCAAWPIEQTGETTMTEDQIHWLDDEGRWAVPSDGFIARARAQIERLRQGLELGGATTPRLQIVTRNTFPTGAGIASSASGFSALTLAVAGAFGVELDPEAASCWSQASGSGSAARSVIGGYVEWPREASAKSQKTQGPQGHCPAFPLATAEDWPLADVVAILDASEKSIASREGHQRATSSPHFVRRLELLPHRLEIVRRAIAERDLEALGSVLEEEAIELHLIAMSSQPPIFYWQPGTLAVLERVRELRQEGILAYSTIDAGPNVHVITAPEHSKAVAAALSDCSQVKDVLEDRVGSGPRPEPAFLDQARAGQ